MPYDAKMVRRKRLSLFYELYRKKHSCCPECGSTLIEETLMGFSLWSKEKYKDGNHAKCFCGWKGKSHDLVDEK